MPPWPAYVINLADSTARLEAVTAEMAAQGIGFERIEAVDGRRLPPEEIAAAYDAGRNRREGRHPLVASEIGCYLSHLRAWERIAAGEAGGGFVFEDDFAARPHLAAVLEALAGDGDETGDGAGDANGTGGWDMVKLFTLHPDVPLSGARALLPGVSLGIPYRVPTCLIAYGLTRAAAGRLCARALPFFRPVDEDQKFVWETGLRVALVLPPPVAQGRQETAAGTVGAARRAARRRGLGPMLRSLRYGMRYRAALARHRKAEGWRG